VWPLNGLQIALALASPAFAQTPRDDGASIAADAEDAGTQLQAYLDGVAKSLVERIYGPQGLPWGTRLTELEDTVLAIRQYLSEQMLNQALQRQADSSAERPTDYRDCPSCGGTVETRPPPSPNTGTEPGAGPPPPEPRGLSQ